jgi:glycine oxidase
VIGGGVAGCATAYYLSVAGVRVTIVERAGIGSQASGWSAGGLNPLQGVDPAVAAFALESYRLHLELWPVLERVTGLDVGGRVITMALVAPDAAAVPALQELGDTFDTTDGFSAEWLDATQVRALEPRVSERVAGALLTKGNGVVDSYGFTIALAGAAQHFGASVVEAAVTGIRQSDGRVTGVEIGDEVIACGVVIVALGPWSGAAETWFGVQLPVEPLKGEILRMALAGPPLPFDIAAPGISLFSRADGQVWLASTRQRLGFDTQPSDWAYRTLFDAAVGLMPSLRDATLIQQTACLRPVTADDNPIVGAVPGWSGAYVTTGGGSKGILLAPAMGRALTDLILAGEMSSSIEAFDPGRFVTPSA